MATVAITGGSGMIGQALSRVLLDRGYELIILTRNPRAGKKPIAGLQYASWDPARGTIDPWVIEKADHIIHLAGAGIADKRWTKKRKAEIASSRVEGGLLLFRQLAHHPNQVKSVVSASAIGWYGPDPGIPNPVPFTEEAPAYPDFLGNTCKLWEESIDPVSKLGIRLVKLRIGIVLSPEGGALKEFLKPIRWGVAGIPGSGRQVMSWIHITDLVNAIITAMENEAMNGVYNAVAPAPVATGKLIKELARIRRTWFLPVHVPAFLLRWVLGEMSIEVLKSTTVGSGKLSATGFQFKHPEISGALKNLSS